MLPGGKTAGIAFCAGYHYPDAAIPILPKYLVRPYVPDRRRGWRQTAHHRPVLRLLLHTGQQILPLPYGKGKADGDLRTQQGERIRAGQAAGTPGLRCLPKGEPLRPGARAVPVPCQIRGKLPPLGADQNGPNGLRRQTCGWQAGVEGQPVQRGGEGETQIFPVPFRGGEGEHIPAGAYQRPGNRIAAQERQQPGRRLGQRQLHLTAMLG